MRTVDVPFHCLGERKTVCDGCAREILIVSDRRHCLECNTDYCFDCLGCTRHEMVTYPGFPRIEPLGEMLAEARKHLDECLGQFEVEDDIYLVTLRRLQLYLQAQLDQEEGSEELIAGYPGWFRDYVESHGEAFLRDWTSLRSMGRWVDYFDRRSFAGRTPDLMTWRQSQGSWGPLHWNGRPMMRTVWDFALGPIMVAEIRPKTIIELGTASGASAMWYADLQKQIGLAPNVITMDISPPALDYEGVEFIEGNVFAIEEHLPHKRLAQLPHPWIFVEDAHLNVTGILEHLDQHLVRGDYLNIEDIDAEAELGAFLRSRRDQYRVDTRYTDYFGHNATCCADQILRRMSV